MKKICLKIYRNLQEKQKHKELQSMKECRNLKKNITCKKFLQGRGLVYNIAPLKAISPFGITIIIRM
jgi:hypothetical protein